MDRIKNLVSNWQYYLRLSIKVQPGTLYGISVGTGDPELITLKGLRLLQQAPVVAFPAGVNNKPGIAEQIVSIWLQPQQTTLSLDFPFVQAQSVLVSAWSKAAKQVWQYLQQGQDVAFACEGDVSFYSTFTYLAQSLQKLYPEARVKTVPGVCSPVAAASVLQLPLTVRAQNLVILPAIYQVSELETVLDWADVVVLLKVSSVYQQVWQVLQRRHLLASSWIVERATFADSLVYQNLTHYPQLKLSYFSLLLIQVNSVSWVRR